MIMKFASLLILVVEMTMLIWEVHFNRKMRKLGLRGYEKISEEERR
jgi:hypothetical protein